MASNKIMEISTIYKCTILNHLLKNTRKTIILTIIINYYMPLNNNESVPNFCLTVLLLLRIILTFIIKRSQNNKIFKLAFKSNNLFKKFECMFLFRFSLLHLVVLIRIKIGDSLD